ncbi:MAG: hypothetical protein GY846_10220, partial [Deltaproteobacteria bacterium]|nr:hypothetical protein [Deltaproteobacteria bacterium]
RATADRWVVVHGGRVVGMGMPRELLRDESLIRMGALHPVGPLGSNGDRMDGYGRFRGP